MPVTIKDVAGRAKVAIGTVSRVINSIQLVLVVCLTSVTQRVRNVLDQG